MKEVPWPSSALEDISELCRRAHGDHGPAEGLRAIATLRARLEVLERRHVSELLAEGASWTTIAEPLGISRQAAHRRFRDTRPARPPAAASTEVNRILVTGVARDTVRLAREEARSLGAKAVGTEHLLLALVASAAAPVASALAGAGIDEHGIRSCLQPTIVSDDETPEADGRFTPYAREVLEGSLREAVEHGEGFIGADHLLLALLRNPAGGAAQTLDALGVEPRAALNALEDLQRAWAPDETGETPASGFPRVGARRQS